MRNNNDPKHVRNFYLRGDVSGLKQGINTGPIGEGGEFSLRITVRENGSISDHYVDITGEVEEVDGQLSNVLKVGVFDGDTYQKGLRLTVPRDDKSLPQKRKPKLKGKAPGRKGAFWEVK